MSGQVEQMTLRMRIVRISSARSISSPQRGEPGDKQPHQGVVPGSPGDRRSLREGSDRAIAVLPEVGQLLAEGERNGKLILVAPQVLGVEVLTNSQVTIRMLTKTLPFT